MGLDRIRAAGVALLLSALAVSGCSKRAEEPNASAPVEPPTQSEPAPAPPPERSPVAVPAPAPSVAEVPKPEVPAARPISREAQMLDDAAATGMTARLPRGADDTSDRGNGSDDDAH